jgi:hypothetical protein
MFLQKMAIKRYVIWLWKIFFIYQQLVSTPPNKPPPLPATTLLLGIQKLPRLKRRPCAAARKRLS